MFICWLSPNKKKKYTVLEFGKLKYCRNKIFCILFIKGTQAWYTRVLCCMVLEFTKLEFHIIFFNRTNSNSAVPRWQSWWGTRVSETRILEKVVLCHLFPKQCFFAKNFYKWWYLAQFQIILSIFSTILIRYPFECYPSTYFHYWCSGLVPTKTFFFLVNIYIY